MNGNNPGTVANRSEDRTTYYYSNGQRYPLVKEPTVYAVKFAPGDRSDSTTLSERARRFLREESKSVEFIPNYGIQVYRVLSGRSSGETPARVQETVEALNREKAVEFATVALRRTPQTSELMYATNRFVAQFKPQVTEQQIRDLNVKYHVSIVQRLDYLDNGYLLEASGGEAGLSAIALANLYYESGLTEFSHPDFIQQRHWKTAATLTSGEPGMQARERSAYLAEQWHLQTAKVVDAWNITRGSPQITIAILDDGVDMAHPEFSGKVTSQFDFGSNTADGNPKIPQDRHGTACAGVAVAAGVKAAGAAPGCKLMAVRTPDYMGTSDEARMFRWVADQDADIISCSWGPQDGTGAVDPLPDITRAAIRHCVQQGRGGKGIPIFWAAGNGNESVSLDGYAANPDVMAIAASTSRETRAPYSDFGTEIFICAPSSGRRADGDQRIFTVDRLGAAGYNTGSTSLGDTAGDYTNDFGGTSSSTPLVAGIAGLMLSVNPNLTVSQVKEILQQTADKIGSGYSASGHSDQFGYGRVNALAALREVQRQLGGGGSSATPSIQAAATIARNADPPVFQINPSPNSHYAVEVATRPELFNRASHQAERNANNFYASWQDTAFLSAPSYILPVAVWNRLKGGDRLYYRLWTSASGTSWVNHAVTVADASALSAPSIEIRETQSAKPPFIVGTLTIARSAPPPVFQINPSPNSHYAVEVANRAELFNRATHQTERTASNFYASWQDTAFLAAPTYTLPVAVWERLKQGDRLYYRLWTSASNSGWMNHATTIPDASAASAPMIQITPSSIGREERWRSDTPSGVPPFGVPLSGVTILGPFHLDSHLQQGQSVEATFQVLDTPHSLTTLLHWTADNQFAPRYLALHTRGDIPRCQYRVRMIASPMHQWTGGWQLLTATGASTIHLPAPTEPGVSIHLERGKLSSSALTKEPIAPAIVGPENWDAGSDQPPSFTILPGSNRFYAIEVATDWSLLDRADSGIKRTPHNFFASWETGLQPVIHETTTFTLPLSSWTSLRRSPRLYYRVLTASSLRPDWSDYQASTPDWMASQAPWIALTEAIDRTIAISSEQPYLSSHQARQQDEQRWRNHEAMA